MNIDLESVYLLWNKEYEIPQVRNLGFAQNIFSPQVPIFLISQQAWKNVHGGH